MVVLCFDLGFRVCIDIHETRYTKNTKHDIFVFRVPNSVLYIQNNSIYLLGVGGHKTRREEERQRRGEARREEVSGRDEREDESRGEHGDGLCAAAEARREKSGER